MGIGSKVVAMTKKKTFILGVTGVIGSGKSTLCRFLLDKYGFHWISADKVVHELYEAGKPGYQKIKEYFGDQFVGKKGVNRGRLRQFVLKSPQKMWILNKLIHPLVVHEVNKKIVQLKGAADTKEPIRICIEAVYFEPQDLGKFIDQLIIVDAPDEVILKRLKARKITLSQLKQILILQLKNLPKCRERIVNDSSFKMFRVNAFQFLRQSNLPPS